MTRELPRPLHAGSRRLALAYFGIDVDLYVQSCDLKDAEWFFGQHRRDDAGTASLAAYVHADDGFFASLLRADSALKTLAMMEKGVPEFRTQFRDWSSSPSVVPPFRSRAFRQSFAVFPGAAVRPPGSGLVVLVGPNYVGKTALLLELMLRGWEYVSDSLVVVHQASGTVQPLLGTLGFRRKTLERWRPRLRGMDTRRTISSETGEVELVRVSDLFGDQLGGPGPVATLVRLDAGCDRPAAVSANAIYPPGAVNDVLSHLPAEPKRITVGPSTSSAELADVIVGSGDAT
jgi:hypothetical protein